MKRNTEIIWLTGITLLALILRGALAILRYTPDFMHYQSGDYNLYYIGAQHLRDFNNFTNSLFLVRPPLYSILIAASGLNNVAVLIMGVILGTLIVPVTYVIWRSIFSEPSTKIQTVGLIAALLVALDPVSVVYSAFLAPEPLANLLLALLIALIITLATKIQTTGRSAQIAVVAALVLSLGSLTRPAAFLIWIPFGVWLALANRTRQGWLIAGIFMLFSATGMTLWIIHNGQVFGNYTFSTIGPFTMTYYRAAAVEHLATGKDMNSIYIDINTRVEATLNRPPDQRILIDENSQQNYLAATPAVQNALYSVSFEIFKAHPVQYILGFGIGAVRMFAHTESISGSVGLLDIGWNILLTVSALFGFLLSFWKRNWLLFWPCAIGFAYFIFGTLLVKSAGMDTRERSMLTPLLAICASFAILQLYNAWAQRRESSRQI